jgi:hypothetical protein
VNAPANIPLAIDVNLTEIMLREQIAKIERFPRVFSVVLMDGRLGIAPTVGEALRLAQRPDAENIRRMAA